MPEGDADAQRSAGEGGPGQDGTPTDGGGAEAPSAVTPTPSAPDGTPDTVEYWKGEADKWHKAAEKRFGDNEAEFNRLRGVEKKATDLWGPEDEWDTLMKQLESEDPETEATPTNPTEPLAQWGAPTPEQRLEGVRKQYNEIALSDPLSAQRWLRDEAIPFLETVKVQVPNWLKGAAGITPAATAPQKAPTEGTPMTLEQYEQRERERSSRDYRQGIAFDRGIRKLQEHLKQDRTGKFFTDEVEYDNEKVSRAESLELHCIKTGKTPEEAAFDLYSGEIRERWKEIAAIEAREELQKQMQTSGQPQPVRLTPIPETPAAEEERRLLEAAGEGRSKDATLKPPDWLAPLEVDDQGDPRNLAPMD